MLFVPCCSLTTIRSVPPQWPHVLTSMLKTRLRRCAQVIERRFSLGLRRSLLAPVDAASASLQCGEAQHETLLCSDGCTVFRAASSPPIGVFLVHG